MIWSSNENNLCLNPRLGSEARVWFEKAWAENVEGLFAAQVGIATSGSSGDAHGSLIVLGKEALLASARAVNERLRSSAADVWLKALPDFHVGGLGILARAHLSGARVVETRNEKWDASAVYREILENDITLLSLVPTQLFDLVGLYDAPRTLRAVIIGGGRLEADLHARARARGWPVLASYGLTECSSQVATALHPDDLRLMPLDHVEVRIGDDENIEIRSRALLTAKIDASGRLTDPKRDGWFRTEDRGELAQDGSLLIRGRAADFIKIGGEGVLVSRLESAVARLAAGLGFQPREYALLAAADERLGARIVLLTERPADELVDAFNREVLPFERIRSVHLVKELPRSALGKLIRAEALATVGLKLPANL